VRLEMVVNKDNTDWIFVSYLSWHLE